MFIQPVVEDSVQELILIQLYRKLLPQAILWPAIGKRGNSYIKERLKGYNEASRHTPYIVLTDLDNIPCPPDLIHDWVNFTLSSGIIFRVAVREAEAWLLADRKGFAKYMGVTEKKIPLNSEEIQNPKEFIISLARKSKKKAIKADMVPKGISKVGPGYNSILENFIANYWNITEAINHSGSLKKAILRIQQFKPVKN